MKSRIGYYKILRRQIYCTTIKGWLQEMIWIFIAMKFCKTNINEVAGRKIFD